MLNALAVGAAFALPGGALAQAINASSTTPQFDSAPSGNDLGEIVVTAQKRSERLEDVPISIATISGDTLTTAGRGSMESLTNIVPGLVIDGPGFQLTPTIRGIGATAEGAGIQSDVATYLDGVYQADQSSTMFDLGDVSDIEVLKGPQGTVFGRNATGGAILIKTLDPSTQGLAATLNAEYGRLDETRLNGYVNVPMSDELAANVSAGYVYGNGWIHDLRTGADVDESSTANIRSKLLYRPSEDVKFIVTAWAGRVSDPTGMFGAALNGNSIGNVLPGGTPIASTRGESSNSVGSFIDDTYELSGRSEINLGFANLATISAYHWDRSRVGWDLTSSYSPIGNAIFAQRSNVFTQEVNLTSKPGDRLSYTVGSYYLNQTTGYPYFVVGGTPAFNSTESVQAVAGYADGSYRFGHLSFLAGVRYSWESNDSNIGPGDAAYTIYNHADYTNTSPRVGLSYAVGDQSNVYGTFSQGFKSGGFNLGALTTIGVQPETVNAYEVGFKTASQVFSFSAATYYYDYKNIQVTAYEQGGSTVAQLLNAAKATIYGADVDATVKASEALDFRLASAWTHARYTSFDEAPAFSVAPGNSGGIAGVVDASGNTMLRAPDFTVSGSINYHIPIGSDTLTTSLIPYWSSRVYYSFDQRLSQAAYFTFDARATYATGNHLELYLFGRNLTDKTYATFEQESSLRDLVVFAQPRIFGIGVSYRY